MADISDGEISIIIIVFLDHLKPINISIIINNLMILTYG